MDDAKRDLIKGRLTKAWRDLTAARRVTASAEFYEFVCSLLPKDVRPSA
jgi:hypothetical protein